MAAKERIEMDFRQAMMQADRIDQIAERLSGISNNQFGSTLQNLSAGWRGENASAYLRKGAKLQNKMNGSSNELHSIASDIRKTAKRVYDAEMAALSIIQARIY